MSDELTDNDQIKIEEIHPKLRPLVQAFLAKSKYPYRIFGCGRWLIERNEAGEHIKYSEGVAFYDPEAYSMQACGYLKWQHGDFGRPYKFRIVTRTKVSPKYRDHERQRSVETIDETRALKEMFTHFKPFTVLEIARAHAEAARTTIEIWRSEPWKKVSESFALDNDVICKEVANLLSQGVKFITPEFEKVAKEGIAAHEEYEARKKTRMHKRLVHFKLNGNIVVTNADSPDKENPVDVYTTFEQLPENIQQTISMLRILGENSRIPGVGACINEKMFWVLEVIERKA